jgi:hypothetical protein
MADPVAEHLKHLFFDEDQDTFNSHPHRVGVYHSFGLATARLDLQRVFVGGSNPPHLHHVFLKAAFLHDNTRVIRGSTDRPELGYHVLNLPHGRGCPTIESLCRLTAQLKTQLLADERIVVFFQDDKEAEVFARKTKCAVYHSKLPSVGNTKAYNIDRWQRGETVVLAATTAFQQGVDYPFIAYIVYYQSAYGMIGFVQGAGRAGRRGRHAYVIILCMANMLLATKHTRDSPKDTGCAVHFNDLIRSADRCLRHQITSTMDGGAMAISCIDNPACNPCGRCDSNSVTALFIRLAVNIPITHPRRPDAAPRQQTTILLSPPAPSSDDQYGQFELTEDIITAMDSNPFPQVILCLDVTVFAILITYDLYRHLCPLH